VKLRKYRGRISLIALAVFLLAAWLVPKISADRYREPIHAALENALGRKVEIGEVRFRLLPQPGFTIANVTIGEDPRIGAEPAAYVTTLRAVPRITALFGGPLEFASVNLEDASLNLTRVDHDAGEVRWNFSSLMRPNLMAAFPSIHMRGGRINFKFGETKSIFYLLDTDVDFWPPASAQGHWTLRVHAEPARTDRPARGFGSFIADGEWHPRDSSMILDVKLEKSELGDMLTLFNGQESGVLGEITGNAHLAGPLTHMGLAGRVTISDLHGWNQTPPPDSAWPFSSGNAWPFSIGGIIDAPGQVIDISARLTGAQSPLGLRYRVADYLRRPRWAVTVNVKQLPLSPLVGIARNLGSLIPADFRFDGTADGAVSYSIPEGSPRMDGALSFANATLAVAGAPPLRIPGASLRFSGSVIALMPAAITNESNETANVQAAWDAETRKLDVSLSSGGMAIASLRRQISVAGIPLLSQATAGTWKGDLHYSSDPPGWNGEVHLQDTDIAFEAFAEPLHIVSADATIDGAELAMKRVDVSMGGMEAQGEYQYQPAALRPHKFRLTVPRMSGAALEKLLMPTLRRGNFLTYAFNFGRVPEPDWLRNMRADGTIQTEALELGGGEFTKLRARVLWDGTNVELAALQAGLGGAAFKGTAFKGITTIHLAQRQPVYEIEGHLTGMPWRAGTIDAEGLLTTSGTGTDLFTHMRAKGSFEGKEIDLAPVDAYDSVAGSFEWTWDARNPRLRLSQLIMKTGDATYLGSAETQDNGQLVLKISDGTRNIQAAGALLRGDALKPVVP
jgi:hypothetical protein